MLGVGAAHDLPLELVDSLHHFDLSQSLSPMADMGIIPSVSFLAELIARKNFGEGYEGIGELAEGMLNQASGERVVPYSNFEEPEEINHSINTLLSPHIHNCSLYPEMVEKRASGIGYFGNGPYIEPTMTELDAQMEAQRPRQDLFQNVIDTLSPESTLGKVFINLGIASLMAKYFMIKRIVDNRRIKDQKGIKIVLVKKSSDAAVVAHLAKRAMEESLPKITEPNSQNGDSGTDIAEKIAKKAVKKTIIKSVFNANPHIGGKLSGLLKIFSIGSKLTPD